MEAVASDSTSLKLLSLSGVTHTGQYTMLSLRESPERVSRAPGGVLETGSMAIRLPCRLKGDANISSLLCCRADDCAARQGTYWDTSWGTYRTTWFLT